MFGFKRKPIAQATETEKPKIRESIWSTDIETEVGASVHDQLLAKLNDLKNGRPIIRKARAQVNADGTVDIVDSADDGDMVDAKASFNEMAPNVSEAILLWYAQQTFITHQLAAVLSQHWLIDKICSMPGEDATRNGFDVVASDGQDLDDPVVAMQKRLDKRFNIKGHMREMLRKGRIFGIRIVIFKIEYDGMNKIEFYENVFNPDGIRPGSYKGMVQVDPYWCTPQMSAAGASQPDSGDFYEPTHWMINGTKYHRSHLHIFRTSDLPDVLKPQYYYGGIPLPQQIMERVYAAERTANEGPQLALAKRSTVFYTDMAAALANWSKFMKGMNLWMGGLNNFGVKIADKVNDQVEQFDTALADVDTVIMTQYQLCAAIGRIPATKVMGTSPKGFGGEGQYENSSYHEFLESIAENDLTPLYDKHALYCARSVIEPKLELQKGSIELTCGWNSADSPTAVEQSQINLNKAQTAAAYVQAGVTDQYDERERLRHDKTSGYSSIPEAVRPDALIANQPTPSDPDEASKQQDQVSATVATT